MAKRPTQIEPPAPLSDKQIRSAFYGGSPEHKVKRWWGGLPKAYLGLDKKARRPGKPLTTICPLVSEAERDHATAWIQHALRRGQYRFYEGDKDFPKHLWYRDEATGQVWFGFLVKSGLGEYKGWPIEEEDRVAVFG